MNNFIQEFSVAHFEIIKGLEPLRPASTLLALAGT